ncbi:conserved hypothetical protein [Formosa agariphila KMM 3901]|uniref:Uncharacterized protein n=1 Tax=Formosa agariphila (strain DSM 15362 / KCTC 12365 / LMG 23005 / KMM 3901 / M-2Alg 35-1) TaxID=1347342 RepID=T2KM42_FORAG|nr:hypothetical protein [Formosa agariphila]CDF79528.1 conserved hypothetical protein [Formosa agariphila KMM 3901]
MPRKFKSGDWVKVRGKLTTPKMQVLKYVPKRDPLLGGIDYDNYLECVWYARGDRKVEIFHQNKLIKSMETGGLYSSFSRPRKRSVT